MKEHEDKSFDIEKSPNKQLARELAARAFSLDVIEDVPDDLDSDESVEKVEPNYHRAQTLNAIVNKYDDHPAVKMALQRRRIRTVDLTGDFVTDFLNEAGSYEPLTDDDTARLFGDLDQAFKLYQQVEDQDEPMTPEQELIFIKAAAAHRVAHATNMFLAYSVALRYFNFNKGGLEKKDHIQEANIGLLRAVSGFEISKGNQFSTYAHPAIRRMVQKNISDNAHTISVPGAKQSSYLEAKRRIDQHSMSGNHLSPDEIEKITGIAYDTYIDLARIVNNSPSSLDAPLFDTDDFTLGDTIEDETATVTNESVVDRLSNIEDLLKILGRSGLTERQLLVLGLRFGVAPDVIGNPTSKVKGGGTIKYTDLFVAWSDGLTLEIISDALKVSRERVRQIEDEALRKIRASLGDIAR